jgi:cytochrome bd ubiquinol oxidase subunit I
MLPISEVVNLSRFQFGMTAMYHFLFVPLTLGLSVLLGIMETVYVMTGKRIWREMTQFWGMLFGINFAMGVATGITMEFQFGMNWSYYSHYVGDIFGVPLAIEGLMAFFLEATFVGLFFFGWDKLSRQGHLTVTWLLALGTNLSALWILIANGWMQHPVGADFNFHTMRMEVNDFAAVFFNPVAQAKFVHTVSAGYVTGSVFVLAISSYYLLQNRYLEFARRSFTVAAAFGLAASLSVVVLGDESGYLTGMSQRMKLAALEAMWHTEDAPAALTLFGIPDQKAQQTHYEVRIPYVLGLIATRSISKEIKGIDDLVAENEANIRLGIYAYGALTKLHKNPHDVEAQQLLSRYNHYLGYAFLLKRHYEPVVGASEAHIKAAAQDTVPRVAPLFWSFRLMLLCGFWFIALFIGAFWLSVKRRIVTPWFLRLALFSLPLPWIASELGWFVAEYGRQPWVIDGMLPTHMGVSSLAVSDVVISLAAFIVFYSLLAIVEVTLLVKYIRQGPVAQSI